MGKSHSYCPTFCGSTSTHHYSARLPSLLWPIGYDHFKCHLLAILKGLMPKGLIFSLENHCEITISTHISRLCVLHLSDARTEAPTSRRLSVFFSLLSILPPHPSLFPSVDRSPLSWINWLIEKPWKPCYLDGRRHRPTDRPTVFSGGKAVGRSVGRSVGGGFGPRINV